VKKVLLFLLFVVVGFAGFVATRPGTFHIERSTTVSAPAATIQAEIDDFHRWAAWSPWEGLDPAMKKTIEGPASGVGATYHWVGNDKVGEGRMTVTGLEPAAKVDVRLEFMKPWKATNQTAFLLAPEGEGTRVTWTMDGTNDFMGKAMGVFMNMDKMIGADFEKGLASLKSVAETAAAAAPADSGAATP